MNKANIRKKSPIRLIKIAFKADLLACNLVYQKLISKYEDIPTSTQPRKNCNKLSENTKLTIAKVKKLILLFDKFETIQISFALGLKLFYDFDVN